MQTTWILSLWYTTAATILLDMMLNSTKTGAIAASGGYTEGLLRFGITDIHCNGTEQNISLCGQNQVLVHNCQTHDDAGVVCQGSIIIIMNSNIVDSFFTSQILQLSNLCVAMVM
jgi:hypothetical protein